MLLICLHNIEFQPFKQDSKARFGYDEQRRFAKYFCRSCWCFFGPRATQRPNAAADLHPALLFVAERGIRSTTLVGKGRP